jgi:hypothetical protein
MCSTHTALSVPGKPVYHEPTVPNAKGPGHIIRYYPIRIEESNDGLELEEIRKKIGTTFLTDIERRLQERMRVFGLEVMHLTLAAIKCDFFCFIWPVAQQGLAASHDRKQPRSRPKRGLRDAIERTMQEQGLSSADRIWSSLRARKILDQKIIQRVVQPNVSISQDSEGNKHTISKKRFRNLVCGH